MSEYKDEDIITGVASGIVQYFGTSEGASTIDIALHRAIKEAVKQFLEENKDDILDNMKK